MSNCTLCGKAKLDKPVRVQQEEKEEGFTLLFAVTIYLLHIVVA